MGDVKTKVLFVCSKRGARALIAAAYANHLGGEDIVAESACFEKGMLSPLSRRIMEEVDLKIPDSCDTTVYERHELGELFDHVVTICQQSRWDQCPVFQTNVDAMYATDAVRHAWSVQDFAGLEGTDEDRRLAATYIRDQIREDVENFLALLRRPAE